MWSDREAANQKSSMKFRVFSCSIMHETNSFSLVPADLDRFRNQGELLLDDQVIEAHSGAKSELGGVLDLAEEFNWNLTLPLFAHATPSGPVSDTTFEKFWKIISVSLASKDDWDGVLLSLHGAMIVASCPDAEGELVSRVRGHVGQEVPIAVTFDVHANVSPTLAQHANILSTYRTTPHTDQHETAQRAGRLLHRAMNKEIAPQLVYAQRPMFSALDMGRTASGHGPMVDILRRAETELRSQEGLLEISVNAGFDWSDKKNTGPSVVVTYDAGAETQAQAVADRLIDFAWETREIKTIGLLPIEDTLAQAREAVARGKTLLIGDYTDCPGAGAPGDATDLLAAFIASGIEDVAYASIADPTAVLRCQMAGINATVLLNLGGKLDPRFGGGPLTVTGRVEALSDGVYTRKGPYFTGTQSSLGPSALLDINGLKVVIASYSKQIEDREQFRIFGINPEEMSVVICKAINHFRADYEEHFDKLIYVDSNGLVSLNWEQFDFHNIRRPIWPLDDVTL